MPHVLSFRKHVLRIKDKEGLTLKETSQHFKIGMASIARWIKCVESKKTRHKPATKIDREA